MKPSTGCANCLPKWTASTLAGDRTLSLGLRPVRPRSLCCVTTAAVACDPAPASGACALAPETVPRVEPAPALMPLAPTEVPDAPPLDARPLMVASAPASDDPSSRPEGAAREVAPAELGAPVLAPATASAAPELGPDRADDPQAASVASKAHRLAATMAPGTRTSPRTSARAQTLSIEPPQGAPQEDARVARAPHLAADRMEAPGCDGPRRRLGMTQRPERESSRAQ